MDEILKKFRDASIYRERVVLSPFEYDQIIAHIESDGRLIEQLRDEISELQAENTAAWEQVFNS